MAKAYLSDQEVMALPYPDLVRYCDSLLTPDAAFDILVNALDPPHSQGQLHTRTHCPHGHEYTPENSLFSGRYRYCRTCKLDYQRHRKKR